MTSLQADSAESNDDEIERVCQLFDSAWDQGDRPEIISFLQDVSPDRWHSALCALLWIEWEHLRGLGTPPQLDDYRTRFAQHSDTVDEAWRSDFRRFAHEDRSRPAHDGRYVVVRSHACGGLGQVFVAHDTHLDRQVALKEIQHRHAGSLVTKERFVREARITGQLEHPGIVPVYSFGTKEDGAPYYTMRFVNGESLKDAIDSFYARPAENLYRSRALRQLLSRFAYVCNVIEFAHSRGVVHRDLKPANIMLGRHGETLVVDWGLAKELGLPESAVSAAGHNRSVTSLAFTTQGAVIGTPNYMSPEQASGNPAALTAASDIYSLGATLYHLLCGAPPLRSAPADTMMVRIQRGDIPRVGSLKHDIPRPLDAICFQAMSLDPADRYPTAAALADDLEHWLADESVSAFAESWPARTARWARRHSTLVATSLIALIIVATASAGLSAFIAVKNRELAQARADTDVKRQDAVQATANATTSLATAEFERDAAKSIADFMVECFRSPDPNVDNGTVTVAEILDRAFDNLVSSDQIKPPTQARFLRALIDSNLGLGRYPRSAAIAEYAWEFCQKNLDPNDAQLLEIKDALAESRLKNGQLAEAVTLFEQVVTTSRERYGERAPMTLAHASHLASALEHSGRSDEAFKLAQQILPALIGLHGPDHDYVLATEQVIGCIALSRSDTAEAIRILSRVTERTVSHWGDDSPRSLIALNSLANAYDKAGRPEEAVALLEQNIERRTKRFGPNHPFTLNAQNNLASAYSRTGKLDEAVALHQRILAAREQLLGANHESTITSVNNVASSLFDCGRLQEAIAQFRRAAKSRGQIYGVTHPLALQSHYGLALALSKAGFAAEALGLLEEYVKLREQSGGPMHIDVLNGKARQAVCLRQLGKTNEAVSLYRDLLPAMTLSFGEDNLFTLAAQNSFATLLAGTGDSDHAIELFQKTLLQQERVLGKAHHQTLQTRVNIGVLYESIGKAEESIALLEAVLIPIMEEIGPSHPLALQANVALASAFATLGRNSEATKTYETLIDMLTDKLGADHSQTITAKTYLGGFLFRIGQEERGIECLASCLQSYRVTLGDENTQTQQCIRDLALVFYETGRFAESEPLWHESVEFGRSHNVDAVTQARNLQLLAVCQLEQKKFAECEQFSRECLAIRQQAMPGDFSCAVSRSMLGLSLAGQSKFEEAEHEVLSAHEQLQCLRDAIPVEDHDRLIREAIGRAVKVYELWGKHDQAAKWTQLGAN